MAEELKHQDAGNQLTQTEYAHPETHVIDGQTNGDIAVAEGGKLIRKTPALYRAILDIPVRMPDNFGRVIRIKDNVSQEGDIF